MCDGKINALYPNNLKFKVFMKFNEVRQCLHFVRVSEVLCYLTDAFDIDKVLLYKLAGYLCVINRLMNLIAIRYLPTRCNSECQEEHILF